MASIATSSTKFSLYWTHNSKRHSEGSSTLSDLHGLLQQKELDAAVKALMAKPALGEQKKGDLAFLRVYKFNMNKQLTLLGYSFDDGTLILELMALGSHENFYRDIKRRT